MGFIPGLFLGFDLTMQLQQLQYRSTVSSVTGFSTLS